MHPLRRRSGPRSVRPWWRAPVVAAGALGLMVALVVVNVDRTSVRVVRSTRSDVSVSMTVPDASTASTVPMPDVVPPVASTVTVPPVTPPPVTSPPVSSPPVSSPPVTSPPVTSPADPEAAFADPNLFVALLPQLSSEPAPTWVNQGTRLTYVASAASVPGAYHQYVEDENGGWVDPATGDRYRQEDIPAAVGHGYNQVTVTELNDALAVLSIRTYGFIGLDSANPVTTLTWGGSVGIPGAGADYWLHPDALTGVVETVSSGLKVVRMPYVIDGTAYRSIWVQLIGDDGNFTWVYDEDSGVLLHTSSSTTGPPITGPVAEGEGRDGSTFLTQSTLVGVRQIDLPWIDESAPPWVATIDHFEYAGEVTVSVGGSPSVVLDASLSVDRLESATDWARYRVRTHDLDGRRPVGDGVRRAGRRPSSGRCTLGAARRSRGVERGAGARRRPAHPSRGERGCDRADRRRVVRDDRRTGAGRGVRARVRDVERVARVVDVDRPAPRHLGHVRSRRLVVSRHPGRDVGPPPGAVSGATAQSSGTPRAGQRRTGPGAGASDDPTSARRRPSPVARRLRRTRHRRNGDPASRGQRRGACVSARTGGRDGASGRASRRDRRDARARGRHGVRADPSDHRQRHVRRIGGTTAHRPE